MFARAMDKNGKEWLDEHKVQLRRGKVNRRSAVR
jgi:hypothetical protein